MAANSYQSPWRGSIVMAPSGRSFSQGASHYRSGSFSPRTSLGASSAQETLPPDLNMMDGLKKAPLQVVAIPKSDAVQDNVKVEDCAYIGSYNWLKRDEPTILVPGSPPQWQNRATPYTIPPDTGVFFSDQNGYRIPKTVLLPLIVAVNKHAETSKSLPFDWPSMDIVTDRNNLRKLMRWVSGNAERDFRIDLQLAGKRTVLMNRWEKRTREAFSGRTFGYSFEKASTSPAPGCKDSTGHHRIISYDLNGLKMVVRFEVDACIPPPAKYPRKSISSIDELADSLNAVSLSSPSRRAGDLHVMEGGTVVSATAVIELTTRSQASMKSRFFDWKEAYPQLFFSQTAHHFLAIHQRGRFYDVQKRKLSSDELQTIEADAQVDLKRVRMALELIQDIVMKHGKKGRISLVCVNGVLNVYERDSDDSCLPDPIMDLFETS
ncbi:hypothetical protein CPB84DRAFT_1734556 [Gymnopilus junonius]|uniref:Geranylgeranyl pyrophosphate synthetase n=1 Tax=Gymnopilus junonius TaxID=109634 RepID=A0A9P5NF03_GYMJU|nr:hypothetical protein CPB84DRAFT_1734556 [Gymnopilus junonius]